MRITRDLLINLAHEQTDKLVGKDRSIQCIYLVGSLLRETPFLGGVTDIDLVCVHDRPVKAAREIVRINADVHLDIAHISQETFDPPRRLRTDAWIGGSLDEGPLVLYDQFHWFDFTRASASSQYWQIENVSSRSRSFSTRARQTWQQLVDEAVPQGLKRTQAYLDALADSVNALAVLTGNPLSTRRFVLELPERIANIELPEFTGAFVSLFTNESVEPQHIENWTAQWLAAFDSLKTLKDAPVQFVPSRRSYYEKAATTLAPDHPAAALWILLTTWTEIAAFLPKSESLYKEWHAFIHTLELDSKGIHDRLGNLDSLLDMEETFIDRWQEENA